ncbi:FAD-binding protein [Hankyongella ginsenosidimutans]|uniref:FAD-binding protein n=1 Tax=Hankyongella ginsenosidimutans TaxID=1763828 RepID=UPI00319E4377
MAGRDGRRLQSRRRRRAPVPPDPRRWAQPPAHRPCRRRHRLGRPTGAGARARNHPNITLYEYRVGVDLITQRHVAANGSRRCHGAYIYNRKTKQVERFQARATVLATGGASRVYLYSTNPNGSTGDGIAMAWRAGCRVGNMEFNQFHPTCLYHREVKNFLITEAMRGEGTCACRAAPGSWTPTIRAPNLRLATSSHAPSMAR